MSAREVTGSPAHHETELDAGDFGSWLNQTRYAQLKSIGSEVPCGSCVACCTGSYFIPIAPDEERTLSRIPKELLFRAPGLPPGHLLMGYTEEGHCPMFQNSRCSIYEDRPRTCREYDCRILTAAGSEDSEHESIAAQARRWKFQFSSEQDRKAFGAAHRAMKFLTEQESAFPPGIVPRLPRQKALLAVLLCDLFLEESFEPREMTAKLAAAISALRKISGPNPAPEEIP